MSSGTPAGRSAADLKAHFAPEQLRLAPAQLAAIAHDASHYLITPQAALVAANADDVAAAMRVAAHAHLPITFRAGGTSLSGQSSGAGLLVDVRQKFRGIDVLDEGRQVRCEPGATIRAVNARLARYHRMLGPDPASEVACTIGGMVANNSSGMACGTQFNTYATIASMQIVLASGTVIDTGAPDADAHLRTREPEVYRELLRLRARILDNPTSMAQIAQQYSMKNTMGYGLNSLVDFEAPLDILTHLMIGSEGTLGFIASATLNTVPIRPKAATALLLFDRLTHATDALPSLLDAGARTLELMDAASIRAVQPSLPATDPLAHLQLAAHTALLVEVQADDDAELDHLRAGMEPLLAGLPLQLPASFATDAAARAALWTIRKGLYTTVAGARPPGTTALLEDIVVPMPRLSQATEALGAILTGRGYDDAVIFGHAKDGNLHFMISPHLDREEELTRYQAFTEELVDLVLGHGGSLKAEHGTGRIMAPYVQRQFGPELYDVMCRIKTLFDPADLLNPGVLISHDDKVHVRSLKLVPPVDPALDRCVECGYCEPSCPSKDLTTTPRQRIALAREIAMASGARKRELTRAYSYAAVDTCAADSLCVIACPVDIDTGKAMKVRRAQRRGPIIQGAGALAAKHWAGVVLVLRVALGLCARVPSGLMVALTRAIRTVLPTDWIPQVGRDLPGPGRLRSRVAPGGVGGDGEFAASSGPGRVACDGAGAKPDSVAARAPADEPPSVVCFPSCIGALFAPADAGEDAGSGHSPGLGAYEALLRLCERAGIGVIVPTEIDGLCCGTVWQSKGLVKGHRAMSEAVVDALWRASRHGELAVIGDAASCTHGLEQLGDQVTGERREQFDRLRIIDAVAFVRAEVLPRLEPAVPAVRLPSIAVHPTCSTVHLGITEDLTELASQFADQSFVPQWGCCGFAGDRGMLHPELTASATRSEAAQIHAAEGGERFAAYVSANRTCELGMSRATGRTYRHILEIIEAQTRGAGRP